MKSKSSIVAEKSMSPLICRVCGDSARGLNFGVITCMSCKMFFRRHAQSPTFKEKCHFHGTCQIRPETRRFCFSCRLKQCFNVGMDPLLIRYSMRAIRNHPLPKPRIISLLNHDRSTLAIEEWNLLSNIVHNYDEQNLFLRSTNFLKNQISLPPKIRSKDSHTLNHIQSLFLMIHTFINRCPLFAALSADIRKQLIQRNLSVVGGFNGFFLGKEMNIYENEVYSNYIDNIYGNGYSQSIVQASQRLQQDGTLIKILLLVLVFSTNSAIVTYDSLNTIQIVINIEEVNQIQNILATLLWKYLSYRYGLHEAVLRFSSLVKSVLDFMKRMEQGAKIEKHWTMVNNVIEQTTRS